MCFKELSNMTICTNSVISHPCSNSNQAGPGSQTLSSCGKWDQICYEERVGYVRTQPSVRMGCAVALPAGFSIINVLVESVVVFQWNNPCASVLRNFLHAIVYL